MSRNSYRGWFFYFFIHCLVIGNLCIPWVHHETHTQCGPAICLTKPSVTAKHLKALESSTVYSLCQLVMCHSQWQAAIINADFQGSFCGECHLSCRNVATVSRQWLFTPENKDVAQRISAHEEKTLTLTRRPYALVQVLLHCFFFSYKGVDWFFCKMHTNSTTY